MQSHVLSLLFVEIHSLKDYCRAFISSTNNLRDSHVICQKLLSGRRYLYYLKLEKYMYCRSSGVNKSDIVSNIITYQFSYIIIYLWLESHYQATAFTSSSIMNKI